MYCPVRISDQQSATGSDPTFVGGLAAGLTVDSMVDCVMRAGRMLDRGAWPRKSAEPDRAKPVEV